MVLISWFLLYAYGMLCIMFFILQEESNNDLVTRFDDTFFKGLELKVFDGNPVGGG